MSRTRTTIALALLVAGATAGQSAISTAAATKTIAIKDDAFSPKRTTISKGTLVTWRWQGDNPHNVKSRGTKRFKSSDTKSSGRYRVRFTKAGTYRYVCTIHEDDGMTGTIIVR